METRALRLPDKHGPAGSLDAEAIFDGAVRNPAMAS
jgi:hypothetical protein